MNNESRHWWKALWDYINHALTAWSLLGLIPPSAMAIAIKALSVPAESALALMLGSAALGLGVAVAMPRIMEWFEIWRGVRRPRLKYLSDTRTELTTAVFHATLRSAWAKGFKNQGAANAAGPFDDGYVSRVLTSLITDAAMNGHLQVFGRPPSATAYVAIPADTWRLATLYVEDHPRTIYRVRAMARHNVDPARIADVLSYDSLVVDSVEFEALWPADRIAKAPPRRA